MKTIGGLLGRSPFGPLREHMLKVTDCVQRLPSLLKAVCLGQLEEVKALAKEISKIEHEADQIKKRIRDQLSKSLLTSINRAEVLAILKEQDSIADASEEAALLLAVRQTPIAKALEEPLIKTVEEVIQAVLVVAQASEKLVDLEGELTKSGVRDIYRYIEEVQKREWETDRLQQVFLEKLFSMEDQMKPIDVFFLMTVLKQIGRIADHADNTGDCMRRILAK